jgi:hypothetical protein
VGVQPVVKSLFPNVDLESRHPEEALIVVAEKHVVVAGRDRMEVACVEPRDNNMAD